MQLRGAHSIPLRQTLPEQEGITLPESNTQFADFLYFQANIMVQKRITRAVYQC